MRGGRSRRKSETRRPRVADGQSEGVDSAETSSNFAFSAFLLAIFFSAFDLRPFGLGWERFCSRSSAPATKIKTPPLPCVTVPLNLLETGGTRRAAFDFQSRPVVHNLSLKLRGLFTTVQGHSF